MKKIIIILLLPFPIIAVGAYLAPFYAGWEMPDIDSAYAVRSEPPVIDSLPASAATVSFNFDGGYISAYKNALPVMDKAGIKTTQYIPPGNIGREGYVSVENVVEMAKLGHEIVSAEPKLTRYQIHSGTSFAEVQLLIDDAILKRKWLPLLFYRIDEDGKRDSAPHELLQEIVNYVRTKNVAVVTNAQGLK